MSRLCPNALFSVLFLSHLREFKGRNPSKSESRWGLLVKWPNSNKQNEPRYPCTCFSLLPPLCSYITKVYSQKSMYLECISFTTLFKYLSFYLKKDRSDLFINCLLLFKISCQQFICSSFLFLVLWDYPPPLSQLFPELTFLLAHFFSFLLFPWRYILVPKHSQICGFSLGHSQLARCCM